MQLITLTTDWGLRDWYVGKIKGALYSAVKDANIIDITHQINKYDHNDTAFVVRNACLDYPEGTIHIIDVDTYEDKDFGFVVVKYNNQFYICTDNGIPYMIFYDKQVEITTLDHIMADSNFYTFAALDVFVKVTKIIANTHDIQTLGNMMTEFAVRSPKMSFAESSNKLTCIIEYVDDYGNAYLNIDDKTFSEKRKGRDFVIYAGYGCNIDSISQSYSQGSGVIPTGKAMLTISSTNNLELAMRNDNFSKLLGKNVGDEVVIKFVDSGFDEKK